MSDHDKAAKYGIDHVRSDRDYRSEPAADSWQERFALHYLQPNRDDIDQARSTIRARLASGDVVVSIPCREQDTTIGDVLDALMEWGLPPASILVLENGSGDETIGAVRERAGVRLAYQDDVLDTLDWQQLLPVLHLERRPQGKGVAVLAASLFWYYLAKGGRIPQPTWVMAHDAEIRECARYRSAEYLMWALLRETMAHYAKMAKHGRTNSSCMTARSMLAILGQAVGNVDPKVRARAQAMFEGLTRHKWMLTGEFVMRWLLAMRRPFATGFLEETLASTFAEDVGAATGTYTVHVANPNPRLDAANTRRKERMMQQQISNFLLLLALFGIPTNEWTTATVAELNRVWMSTRQPMGWITDDDEPVRAELLPSDRIIPSVTMLADGGFIKGDAVRRFLDKTT